MATRSKPPKRSKLLYALAVLVLAPATAGYLYQVEAKSFGADGSEPAPITAAKGEPLTYEGSTWKLTYAGKGPVADGEKLPDDARLVFAMIEVTPNSAKASKRIEACGFEASDGADRTWRTDELSADLAAIDNPVTGCFVEKADYETGPIPAGEKQSVVAVFLVPEDAVPDLRIRVLLGPDDPPLELVS